jgi:hypothetical protein
MKCDVLFMAEGFRASLLEMIELDRLVSEHTGELFTLQQSNAYSHSQLRTKKRLSAAKGSSPGSRRTYNIATLFAGWQSSYENELRLVQYSHIKNDG